jgi:hypothetical protein
MCILKTSSLWRKKDEVQCLSSQCAKNKVKIVQWSHEYEAKQGSPILGVWGSIWRCLHEARASKHDQERCSILKKSRPSSSSSSGMRKAKV